MTRSAIVAFMSTLWLGPAAAQSVEVDVPTIVRDAKPFIGRTIRVAALRCANEPNGSLACGTTSARERVRIEGLGLDFKTSTETRRKLSGRCRTALASASQACIFDAEFKPLTVTIGPRDPTSDMRVVYVKTRRINLF